MKKFLLTLLTVLMGMSSLTLSAQNTLTVADGTATNSYVPVYGLYVDDFVRCQTIYPAGTLAAAAVGYGMNGGTITSLTYYLSTPASASWDSAIFVVNIKEVTATTLSGFLDMTDATTVYTGPLDGTQATMDITFTTPYTYQGGNLIIEIYNTLEGTFKSASFYGVAATGASWQGNNGTSVANITGTARDFIPKTTFTFTGGSEITCSPVQNLAIDATQTTSSSLTLTWTDAINTGATYTVYNMADNTVIQSGITGNTYTVTGLNGNTVYTFGVETNCSATDASAIVTVSDRTACATISLPWTCSFETNEIQGTTNALAIPWCSERYVSAATSGTTYPYSTTSYPHSGSRAIYVYGTTSTSYPDTMALILPEIDVTTYPMNNNRVSFWAKMSSDSYSKNVYVGTMTNPADITTLTLVDSVVVSGTTHERYFIPMTTASATAPYVVLMFRRSSGSLYLDDLVIEEIPSCPEVTGLAVSNITAHGATLTWNGTADGYTIYEVTANDTTVNQSVSTTTADITSLNADTQYTFGVTSNCGSEESPMVTITFSTLVSCPTPTNLTATYNPAVPTDVTLAWTENGEATEWQIILNNDTTNIMDVTTNPYTLTNLTIDSVYTVKVRANCGVGDLSTWSSSINIEPTTKTIIGSGNSTNSYLPTNCYYNYSLTQQIYTVAELGTEEGLIESIDFYNNSTSERTRDLNIYVVSTAKDTFSNNTDWINVTAADLQYSGSVSFAPQAWTTISLNGFVYNGLSNIAIIVDDNTGSYSSSTPFKAFSANKQALRIYSDGTNYDVNAPTYSGSIETTKNQIRLEMSPMTGCMKPTGLMVNYTGGDQAEVTWVSDAAAFNISVNGNVINNVTSPYTLTGLSLSTAYTVAVQAVCGTTTSDWTNPVNFTTDACMPENQCTITIVGNDSYGDGWNNASISIIQNNATIATFTLPTSTSTLTETFNVCSGMPVSFIWNAGSYDSETSFEIFDGGNTSVHSGSGSSLGDGATFFTMNTPCPSCTPAVLTVDNVADNSVTISWTGTAASYDIYNGDNFVANVTTNTYTFTGLNVATTYTFGVQAICSATDSAAIATITVSTNCADITVLPYNEGFENGLGCWSTVNGSSDGQPWTVNNCASLSSVSPHGGSYVASSWSWSSDAMHANAWLISPKFILPTTNEGLSFSWWEIANPGYPDSYSVVLSTTTNDTAAFTTVVYPYSAAAGSWTLKTIDLTSYAGQSVYLAFHHQDYDENYLLIDDISLFEGAPTPDTLTVTFAVNNAIMGTTTPAPGTYQYLTGDTVYFSATANTGYHFVGWEWVAGTDVDTLDANFISAFIPADMMMAYGSMTLTALFEAGNPDSTTITYAVNDPVLGTTIPAPGTYTIYVGDDIVATAIPNDGCQLSAWMVDLYMNGTFIGSDTLLSTDSLFENPINFGTLTQMYVDYGISITVTAVFTGSPVEPCDVPTGLTATEIGSDHITITWDNNANVTNWNIQYRPMGGTWASVTATSNTYDITGLTPETQYEIQVQANCGNGNLSDWSASITATTTVGIESHLMNSISLYPNPANDVVNVQCTMNNVQLVEVIDVYGKVINTLTVTDNPTQINVSGLASGIYFVRVTTEEGVATKSFVKK